MYRLRVKRIAVSGRPADRCCRCLGLRFHMGAVEPTRNPQDHQRRDSNDFLSKIPKQLRASPGDPGARGLMLADNSDCGRDVRVARRLTDEEYCL